MATRAAWVAARKAGEELPEGGYQGDYLIEWAAEMPDDADPLEWGYARALQSHRETLAEVKAVLEKRGVDITSVAQPQATLEDLFLQTVKESQERPGRRHVPDEAPQPAATASSD